MNKKDLILNTYEELLSEGKEDSSIQDIADRSGIAKGGLYYYFKNKEDLLDAVVDRYYSQIISEAEDSIKDIADPIKKINTFFMTYLESSGKDYLQASMHTAKNSYIHQKSLKMITLKIADILKNIIQEGNSKGVFSCEKPLETSQMLIGSMAFVLDQGIFKWNQKEIKSRIQTCFNLLYLSLGIKK